MVEDAVVVEVLEHVSIDGEAVGFSWCLSSFELSEPLSLPFSEKLLMLCPHILLIFIIACASGNINVMAISTRRIYPIICAVVIPSSSSTRVSYLNNVVQLSVA